MILAMVRVSGIVAFAPFFSSSALPMRAKAVFVGAVAFLLAPLMATLPNARASLSFSALLGELAVGLVYGLTLALLNEMLLFAGQIVGVQFSFSMVNLLDPTSSIQTPADGRSVSTDGNAGVAGSRSRSHFAGLDGAQFSRGSAGHRMRLTTSDGSLHCLRGRRHLSGCSATGGTHSGSDHAD